MNRSNGLNGAVILLFTGLLIGLCFFTTGCVTDFWPVEEPEIFDVPMGINAGNTEVHPFEPAPASGAPEPEPPETPSGPLKMAVRDAVLLALENNRALTVERLNPSIRRTAETEALAEFDPVLSGEVSLSEEKLHRRVGGLPTGPVDTIDGYDAGLGVSQRLPTGTEIQADLTTEYTDSEVSGRQQVSRIGLTVIQSLLEGRGASVNLVKVRQARLDTHTSEYELRGVAESVVAQVERTYWDYALAVRQVKIFEDSLALAKRQLEETREMIEVGKLPESELAAVEAEMASRRQDLIDANSRAAVVKLNLLRLTDPPGRGIWQRDIVLLDEPELPAIDVEDTERHVEVAVRMRPELNQARLGVLRDDLEIVKTRNGLLPVMDVFITLGKSGYADSFGSSFREMAGETYDVAGGFRIEYPLFNRRDRALHQRSTLQREQSEKALSNLAQLVEVDVRSALIEIQRSREQITASRATSLFREESLRVEQEKFRVGRSTNLLVSQAERDLVFSRIEAIEAIVAYQKALVELYRLEGSLLERRGIDAPGRKPVKLKGVSERISG